MLSLTQASGALGSLLHTIPVALANPYALHRHAESGVLLLLCSGDRAAKAGGVQVVDESIEGGISTGEEVGLK